MLKTLSRCQHSHIWNFPPIKHVRAPALTAYLGLGRPLIKYGLQREREKDNHNRGLGMVAYPCMTSLPLLTLLLLMIFQLVPWKVLVAEAAVRRKL